MKKSIITKSTKKNATFLTIILFVGYLIFNFFTVLEINYFFIDNIDVRLKHEIGHVVANIVIEDDTIVVLNKDQFQEYDMLHVTENSFYVQIYDTNGDVIFQSENLSIFQGSPKIILDFDDEFHLTDEKVNYKGLRVCYTKIIKNGKLYGYLQLATPKTMVNKAIENITSFNLLTLPLAFILFLIVSLIFAKRALNPINKIIEISQEITATNLQKRIEYEADSEDELGRLKATLNNLFDRLEFQINELSQFTDNASHQLMTPLTAIKTELEYILKRDFEVEDYKETCNILKDQTDRMISMVKTMLIMSRECSNCVDNEKVFQFSKLLENDIKMINNKRLVYNLEKDIYLRGNSEYFSIAIQNLINNALKYSPKDKDVEITLQSKNDEAIFRVADNGIGIPDSEKNNIFQKFYRVEIDDVQKQSGYGLGLSLVKSVITAMGGKIEIMNNEPNGTLFEVKLPILKFY